MSNNNTKFAKTCSICGELQPITAFVQFAGAGEARYGSVCATCRRAGLDKKKSDFFEDSTTSSTGHKIDSKTKVQSEKDKREFKQLKEETDKEEGKRVTAERQKVNVKKEIKSEGDKKRRESFLDQQRKPQSKPQETRDTFADRAQEEQRTDLTAPYVDTQFAKLKHQSSLLKQFKYGVLGGASPLARAELKNKTEKEMVEDKFKPKGGGRSR